MSKLQDAMHVLLEGQFKSGPRSEVLPKGAKRVHKGEINDMWRDKKYTYYVRVKDDFVVTRAITQPMGTPSKPKK